MKFNLSDKIFWIDCGGKTKGRIYADDVKEFVGLVELLMLANIPKNQRIEKFRELAGEKLI